MADLSGMWLGTYWQNGNPTRFEATFIQSGNTLTGNILDDSYLGEARLSGEVVGRRVQFMKKYLLHKQAPVNYQGTISENENFIQGTWDLGIFDSGNWEAYRSGDNLNLELKNRLKNQVPVSAR